MPLDAPVLQQQLPQMPGRESYRGFENNNNGLIDYISTLGLGDDHISNINCLLLAAQNREVTELEHHPAYSTVRKEETTVSLFFAEEQEILRTTFLASLNDRPRLTLVGSSERISAESLILAALELRPQVLVLGVKGLQPATVEMLDMLREACPGIGLVLLFSFSSQQGMKCLREYSRETSVSCAYLPKHSIDTMEQLEQIVHWVAEGRVIIDPSIMEGLFRTEEATDEPLKGLTPKALEVLKWLAKGYRNEAIAETLSRDTKTVERHINNIYNTLDTHYSEGMHPRVHATLMYLKAVGMIAAE